MTESLDDDLRPEYDLASLKKAPGRDARRAIKEKLADPRQIMHPSVVHVLRFFAYDHLPDHLQAISRPFGELAKEVAARFPDNPETTLCLRKLLEAKDCAVRAYL